MKTRNRRLLQFALAGAGAAAIGALAACTTVPVTGRKELNLVGEDTVNKLGMTQYQQTISQSKMDPDPAHNEMVKRVASRLAATAEREFHPKYQWEFKVIDEPQTVNAWCLPGGKIAVYSGIFKLADNDTALATVLAHEISHALAHHGAERISQSELVQLGETGLLAAVQAGKPSAVQATAALLGLGSQVGIMLPFSRKQESEADHIGLILMSKAGYDPHGALDFWRKMEAYSAGKAPPQFLSDHPSDANRVAALEKEMPEAEQAFQSSGVATAPH